MVMPARRRHLVLRGLLVVVLLIGTVMGILWAVQRQLIYFPEAAQVPPAGEVVPGARDVTLRTDDGLELGAWFFPARNDRSPHTPMAVLVAPGNGGNRVGRAGLAEELSDRGLAVLLMDYRGYGGNPGSPTEEGLAADALAAAEALEALGYPPERTIYFGESLGTGVVAALHVRRPPAGMVLRSPFTELAEVGTLPLPVLAGTAAVAGSLPGRGAPCVERRAGDRDLRGSRHRGALGAECDGGRRRLGAGRTSGDQRCRPQRPGDVRSTGRRRCRPIGPRGGVSRAAVQVAGCRAARQMTATPRSTTRAAPTPASGLRSRIPTPSAATGTGASQSAGRRTAGGRGTAGCPPAGAHRRRSRRGCRRRWRRAGASGRAGSGRTPHAGRRCSARRTPSREWPSPRAHGTRLRARRRAARPAMPDDRAELARALAVSTTASGRRPRPGAGWTTTTGQPDR